MFGRKLKHENAVLKRENAALRARVKELHALRKVDAEDDLRQRLTLDRLQRELEVERGKNLRDDR